MATNYLMLLFEYTDDLDMHVVYDDIYDDKGHGLECVLYKIVGEKIVNGYYPGDPNYKMITKMRIRAGHLAGIEKLSKMMYEYVLSPQACC